MLLALSQSLEILTHHGIQLVGDKMRELASSWVLLSIEEPLWDVVVSWSGNDIIDLLSLFISDFSGSLVDIDLGNLESQVRESSTDTSDLSEAERSLLFTVQVGVLNTKNVLKVICISKN